MEILTRQITESIPLEKVVSNTLLKAQGSFESIKAIHHGLSNQIWDHPIYSAGQIITGLGTDASGVLCVLNTFETALNNCISGSAMCEKEGTYTINSNGSANLT